ncbi:MAG TPA: hypothetical protein PLT66_09280, partial [Bacillota bacterium]|nr:hypothetical protein [Bacillota bacterium]
MPLCRIVSGSDLPVSAQSIRLDMPMCLLATLIIVVPALITKRFSRVTGIILLCIYAVYLVLLCTGIVL